MSKDKSLVSNATHVTITLPKVDLRYSRVDSQGVYRCHITWGNFDKVLSWDEMFMRSNAHEVGENITTALKEVCEMAKPYKLEVY